MEPFSTIPGMLALALTENKVLFKHTTKDGKSYDVTARILIAEILSAYADQGTRDAITFNENAQKWYNGIRNNINQLLKITEQQPDARARLTPPRRVDS